MRKYLLVGVPGSGKSTHGALLARDFDLVRIGAGDILRWHVAHRTRIGARVREAMAAGRLVDDSLVEGIVHGRLQQVLERLRRKIPVSSSTRAVTRTASRSRSAPFWACVRPFRRFGGRGSTMNRHFPGEIMPYQSINPYNGQVLATYEEISDSELEYALGRARSAYDGWRRRSFDERAAVTRRAAGILRERRADFARLMTLEMGKLIGESVEEVLLAADIFDYYADNAEDFLKPVPIETRHGDAVVDNAPLGVLFGVQPWNFPYYQLARFAVPNVMAGNVVMVKHASSVPQCAKAFEDLYRDAGAPEGVYTNLFVTKDQVARAIEDPRVMGVALTGSEAAGADVARRAGGALKKTTLELGGSDPLIALPDADLGSTVHWAAWGRLNNCGQCCVATKRLLIHEQIADKFLEEFTAALAGLAAGDPLDEGTTLAPMSSRSAADRLRAQVDEAVDHGAQAIPVGERVPEDGAFVQPTILLDVTPDNPVYDQELFGPVVMFFRFRDEDEAISIANDTGFGLGGAVFTSDLKHGREIARRIDSGMVFINRPTWTAPELPFGGVKRSGYGRELSWLGIQEFVNKKLIDVLPVDTVS